MSNSLLLMGPLYEPTMHTLESDYQVAKYYEADDAAALLASIADECVGVVTDGGRGVQNDIKAKVVSVFGVGVDAVDLDFCESHGISVGNTPHVLSDDVADLAVALALATCRKMVRADRYSRDGLWSKSGAFELSTRMTGKRAGIFGMGSIGESLAQRLAGFNMDVSYCNRSKKPNSPLTYVDSLEQLAANVDFLFITAAATTGSIGAVNEKVLEALGKEGYLINVSRGTLADEAALVDAIVGNKIAGAGLDVFENEPAIPEALCKHENVVLQPHVASGTFETRKAMGDLMLENLKCHFDGKPLTASVV